MAMVAAAEGRDEPDPARGPGSWPATATAVAGLITQVTLFGRTTAPMAGCWWRRKFVRRGILHHDTAPENHRGLRLGAMAQLAATASACGLPSVSEV